MIETNEKKRTEGEERKNMAKRKVAGEVAHPLSSGCVTQVRSSAPTWNVPNSMPSVGCYGRAGKH